MNFEKYVDVITGYFHPYMMVTNTLIASGVWITLVYLVMTG